MEEKDTASAESQSKNTPVEHLAPSWTGTIFNHGREWTEVAIFNLKKEKSQAGSAS